jgi:hypothetical protein
VDELVARLSAGDHDVEASLRPAKTVKAFKECIDRGYVHIKFTETKGRVATEQLFFHLDHISVKLILIQKREAATWSGT